MDDRSTSAWARALSKLSQCEAGDWFWCYRDLPWHDCLPRYDRPASLAGMAHVVATPRRVCKKRHPWRRTASRRQRYNYFRDYDPGTGR